MQKNNFQVITTSQLDFNDDFFNVEAENLFFNYLVIHPGINFNSNLKRIFIHSFRILNCQHKMYAYDNIEPDYSDYGFLEQLKIPFGCKIYPLDERITLEDDEDKFETILNDTIEDEYEITLKFVKANKNK